MGGRRRPSSTITPLQDQGLKGFSRGQGIEYRALKRACSLIPRILEPSPDGRLKSQKHEGRTRAAISLLSVITHKERNEGLGFRV